MSRNIFITGGTSGIGLELAKRYVERGDRVGICGLEVEKLNELWPEHRQKTSSYQVDVTCRDDLLDTVSDFEKGGEVDLMIACAGIGLNNKTSVPDFSVMRSMIEINVIGVVNTFEAVVSKMMQRKSGQIVVMSSVAAYNGLPGNAGYCASKTAVTNLCESLAIDLSNYGISVCAIHPGFIKTPLTEDNVHKMLFLMDVEHAAAKIIKAIDKKKMHYTFPWQMELITKSWRLLPRRVYYWLVKSIFAGIYHRKD